LFRNLILSFSLQYSRYKEVRDALDIDITEMQKNALDLKKVSAEHYVPTKDYVSVGLLSNACLKMEQIADILDATSDKL
jgi:ribosomal protein L10